MNNYSLLEAEIDALEAIAVEIYKHKELLPTESWEAEHKPSLVKLGSLLGYRGNSIYQVKKSGELPKKKLEAFRKKLEELRSRAPVDSAILKIINHFNDLYKVIDRQNRPEKFAVGDNDKRIQVFMNKKFFIFERFFDSIGRKVISFGGLLPNGRIEVRVHIALAGMEPWKGEAYLDSSKNFLVILTENESQPNSLVTNYLIRVKSGAADLTMAVGHMQLINDRMSVLSKSVVFVRTMDPDPQPDNFSVTEDETEKKHKNVPLAVRKFLYDRQINRLSSPHTAVITSEKEFDEWHAKNELIKRENRNEAIIGTYQLFYARDSKDELTNDVLVIEPNKYTGDLAAEYTHMVGTVEQKWKGSITYSPVARAIFLDLKGPVKTLVEGANLSPIFLILNIPYGERKIDAVAGIVSGILDDLTNSVTLMCLAVQSKEKINENVKAKIDDFFEANNNQRFILPPKPPDLRNVLSGGANRKSE